MNLVIKKLYDYWKEEGTVDVTKTQELENLIPNNLSDDMEKTMDDIICGYEKFGFEAGFTAAYKMLSCLKEI